MIYLPALALHSLTRWLLLAAGVAAMFRSGRAGGRAWDATDTRLALAFVALLHLQLLLGFLLFGALSPIVALALQDMGAAMKDPQLRFFTVEHGAGMMLAFVVAMVSRVRSKKAPDAAARHRVWSRGLLLWLVLTAASIPWPMTRAGRPLFRAFF